MKQAVGKRGYDCVFVRVGFFAPRINALGEYLPNVFLRKIKQVNRKSKGLLCRLESMQIKALHCLFVWVVKEHLKLDVAEQRPAGDGR